MRVLAKEEDAGRALLLALDEGQRAKATINAAAPNDIVTTNAVKIDPLSPVGLPASEMTAAERDLLMRLVDVYTSATKGPKILYIVSVLKSIPRKSVLGLPIVTLPLLLTNTWSKGTLSKFNDAAKPSGTDPVVPSSLGPRV